MNVPIVLGTARKERRSEAVAQYVLKKAKEFGFEAELFDIKDFISSQTIPPWEENSKNYSWKEAILKANALIIVTPEYNHSFPGELKIFLDSLYEEYKYLPVGLCGVSKGVWGGTRVVEHLKPVLTNFGMMPIPRAVNFTKVAELFDEAGNLTNPVFDESLAGLFEQLKEFSLKMRP